MSFVDVLRAVSLGGALILALLVLRLAYSRARQHEHEVEATSWAGLLSYVLLLVGSAVSEYRQIGKGWTWWLHGGAPNVLD